MLIACVKQGEKYGADYVRRLKNGVERHLPPSADHPFVCFTDKPVDGVMCEPLPADLPGWWAKLGMFRLREPMLYLDLDIVVIDDLTPAIEWDGFGIIDDWWLPGFNSSVMKLTGNEGHVWDRFRPDMIPKLYMGDQQWVSHQMPDANTFPPEWFPSYKAGKCSDAIPSGALAVIMHGDPKPAEITTGWVPEYWR